MLVSNAKLGLVAFTLLSACANNKFAATKKTNPGRATAAERGRVSVPESDAYGTGKNAKSVSEADAHSAGKNGKTVSEADANPGGKNANTVPETDANPGGKNSNTVPETDANPNGTGPNTNPGGSGDAVPGVVYPPGSRGIVPPGATGTFPPGATVVIPPGPTGTFPPGTTVVVTPGPTGTLPPGTVVTVTPGPTGVYPPATTGIVTPGPTGTYPPGASGIVTPGPTGTYPPGASGIVTPGPTGTFPPGTTNIVTPGPTPFPPGVTPTPFTPGVTPTPFIPQPTPPPVTGDICAGRTATLRVLILDLKSGWFAGDAGDVFSNFTAGALVCPTQVEIVYAHVTRSIVEGTISNASDASSLLSCLAPSSPFLRRFDAATGITTLVATDGTPRMDDACTVGDLSSFQQVWVLSGSERDHVDVRLASPFLTTLNSRLATLANSGNRVGIFFGAGLGNTQHANAIARAALPSTFSTTVPFYPGRFGELGTMTNTNFFRFTAGSSPLFAGSGSTPGSFNATHPLFTGLSSLADYPRATSSASVLLTSNFVTAGFGNVSAAEGGACFGDRVAAPGFETLATDVCGQKTISAAVLPNGNRIVLDSNLSRFYTATPQAWFNRIVNYLAQARQ